MLENCKIITEIKWSEEDILEKNTELDWLIQSSESSNEIKRDITSVIKKSLDLIEWVKNDELKEKFKKEYDDLYDALKASIKSENEITKSELLELKLEFSDIVTLAEDNNIIEEESFISWFWWKIRSTKDSIVVETKDIFSKDIEDFTDEECNVILKYTNTHYKKIINQSISYWDNNLGSLDNQSEVNIFQEKLIWRVLGEWNRYFNNEYVYWYNNNIWNYLVKISDVENKINSNDYEKINIKELWNYLNVLSKENNLNLKFLSDKFWIDKAQKIIERTSKRELPFIWRLFDKISNTFESFVNEILSFNILKIVNYINDFSPFSLHAFEGILESNDKTRELFLQKNIEGLGDWNINLSWNSKEVFEKNIKLQIEKNRDSLLVMFVNEFDLSSEESELLLNDIESNIKTSSNLAIVDIVKDFTKRWKKITDTQLMLVVETVHDNSLLETIINPNLTKEQKDRECTIIKGKSNLNKSYHFEFSKDNKGQSVQANYMEFLQAWGNPDNYNDYAISINEEIYERYNILVEKQKLLDDEIELQKSVEKQRQEEIKKELNNETKYIKTDSWNEIAYFEVWWVTIIDNNIQEWLIINNHELDVIKSDPNKAENLIKFHEKLDELKLWFIWQFRDDIWDILWDNITIDYLDKNWMSDWEMLKLLNWLLIMLWDNKVWDIDSAYFNIKMHNKKLESEKILWRDPIESYLWKKWFINENWIMDNKIDETLEKAARV